MSTEKNKVLDTTIPQNAPVHGGDIYSLEAPDKLNDFSICLNPLKCPRGMKRKLLKLEKKSDTYADISYDKARKNLAKYHTVEKEQILMGNGCDDLLYLAVKTLKPRLAVIPAPNYSEYQKACDAVNCKTAFYKLESNHNFKLNIEDFVSKIPFACDMVILSNPNNPTGRLTERDGLIRILDYCQTKGIYLVVDESYIEFSKSSQSAANLVSKYANLLVLRSLTQFYALPQHNIGYLIACESIINVLADFHYSRPASLCAQLVCENAYQDEKFIKKTKAYIAEERERIFAMLKKCDGLRAIKSDANYYFIEFEREIGSVICERLMKKGVLTRNAANFQSIEDSYIRVAIKDKKSNDKFIEMLFRCML